MFRGAPDMFPLYREILSNDTRNLGLCRSSRTEPPPSRIISSIDTKIQRRREFFQVAPAAEISRKTLPRHHLKSIRLTLPHSLQLGLARTVVSDLPPAWLAPDIAHNPTFGVQSNE